MLKQECRSLFSRLLIFSANYINDTVFATDAVNQLRDTESGKWFGGFARDNITGIMKVIGIAAGVEAYAGIKLTSGY